MIIDVKYRKWFKKKFDEFSNWLSRKCFHELRETNYDAYYLGLYIGRTAELESELEAKNKRIAELDAELVASKQHIKDLTEMNTTDMSINRRLSAENVLLKRQIQEENV